jgi:hypothetical protein
MPRPARHCAVCGGVFFQYHGKQIYCSPLCNSRAQWAKRKPPPLPPRACDACGRSYVPRTRAHRWCSAACRSRPRSIAPRPLAIIPAGICCLCGSAFLPRRRLHFYCSPNCCKLAWKTNTGRRPAGPPDKRRQEIGRGWSRLGADLVQVPRAVLLDRDRRRAERAARDVSEVLMGDPPRSQSALGQRLKIIEDPTPYGPYELGPVNRPVASGLALRSTRPARRSARRQ